MTSSQWRIMTSSTRTSLPSSSCNHLIQLVTTEEKKKNPSKLFCFSQFFFCLYVPSFCRELSSFNVYHHLSPTYLHTNKHSSDKRTNKIQKKTNKRLNSAWVGKQLHAAAHCCDDRPTNQVQEVVQVVLLSIKCVFLFLLLFTWDWCWCFSNATITTTNCRLLACCLHLSNCRCYLF